MEIRDMTETDENYVGTCTHVGESAEMDSCAKKRCAWMRKMHRYGLRVKVAILKGERVGFAYVMPLEISPWGPLGKDLMVLPCLVAQSGVKRKGVGRALVEASEEETLRQGKKGLVVKAYDHDIWFMPASFFSRLDFSPAHSRDSVEFPGAKEIIMWKCFDPSVMPPVFLEPNFQFEPMPGKVLIDLFWNTFCQTSVLEAERVREVAGEFGDRVILREYCADDRRVLLHYQIERGIYINGEKIGWGYEAPKEGVRKAISSACC